MSRKARIAIVVGRHGRGTNMLAIVKAASEGVFHGEVILVVSPNPNAAALIKAKELGIPTAVETDLLSQLKAVSPDVICLAGYMRLIPPSLVSEFRHRILNIHPSLLPKFGGRGMFARKVQEAVVAAGETISGCTVHFVDDEYDHGDILVQRTCPVLPDDTPDTLAARVLDEEHLAYPEAIRKVLESLSLN